jgi:hypothetical protein
MAGRAPFRRRARTRRLRHEGQLTGASAAKDFNQSTMTRNDRAITIVMG